MTRKEASYEQDLMQTLLDSIPDYVYFKDKNRRFVRASNFFCDLFRCRLEDIIGKKDEDLFPEEIAKETAADDRHVIETGIPLINKEEGGESIGGGEHWVLTTKIPWRDRKGNIIGLFGISRDITDRKRAEEALRESEEKFRNLSELSPNMIFINKKGRLVYVNRECIEAMGYTKEELLSEDFDFLNGVGPEFKDLAIENYNRHLGGDELAPFEHALVTKDGRRLEVLLNSRTIDYEGGKALLGILTDITERKLAEEERDRIINLSSDLICVAGMDGFFKFLNPAWEKTLGYTRNEMLSRPFLDFIHPDDHAKNNAEVERLSAGKETVDFENRYIHKNGTIITISWIASPLPEEGLMYCVGRNITEKKKAEVALRKVHDELEMRVRERTAELEKANEQLKMEIKERKRTESILRDTLDRLNEAEQKYRTVADFTYDWEYWEGPDGRLIYVSPSCERTSGCTVQEFLDNPSLIREIIVPQDREIWDRHYHGARQEIKPREIQFRIQKRDGQIRWIEHACQPVTDNTGRYTGFRASNRDISERKMAEEEMMRSEERFRRLMEQSPLAMEILTPDGQITQVNAAWMRLWGINEEEASRVMANYNMLTDRQTLDLGIAPLIKKAFEGEPVILPEIEYSGKRAAEEVGLEDINGNLVWIQCHLFPVKNENQEIIFVVNTYMDITDLKRAEREAREQRDALARVERATSMGKLTGSISHELNQPLTGILSNAQAAEIMIKKGQCEHDELADIMAEIAADAKRAGDVIRNLRDLYREQKGEFLPTDINAVVKDTTQLLHSEFVTQHVVLTTECTSSIPMVNGNRIQIEQVLVNLIMNGNQAMSGKARNDRRLHIGTAYDANEVKVWVEDCGTGIDADKIDRIFEPLATWKPGGTGMGLAISNSIIEAHGGKIWAENRPEGGARVGFALPVLKEGEQA